jgi:hypothetical protein
MPSFLQGWQENGALLQQPSAYAGCTPATAGELFGGLKRTLQVICRVLSELPAAVNLSAPFEYICKIWFMAFV